VANGKLDGTGFTQFDLVRYVAAGHDLVGVAAIDYSEGAEALVARPGFNSLQDLRGKRIALHRGTYLEYLLAVIAERESFDLSTVTLVDRPNDQALEDLKTGAVDALLAWEPYFEEAQEAVGGVKLFSTAEFPGLTYNVLTFRRDFVRQRPADIAALLKVWQRSVQFIRDHPDETSEIIAQLFHQPASGARELMRTDRILDLADNGRAFSYAAGFESLHGSWRRMNDFQIERGLAARRVDSPAHLDSRFVRALE
jgi:NitT/TauT family transport system substrate-binding protein